MHRSTGKMRKDVPLFWRFSVRSSAVMLLVFTVAGSLVSGGHIKDSQSPLYNISGKIAGKFGHAAQKVSISGLKERKPGAVLSAIGVRVNGSLVGFDTVRARGLLENVDWIKRAEVRKVYPNELVIDLEERVPFAVWQNDGEFYVIDDEGLAFTSVDPASVPKLLLVTGEGANKKVRTLVNHLEAIPGLRSKLRAAARVGQRRWNLYLNNGIKVMLPENGELAALKRYMALAEKYRLADKAVKAVDLRFSDQVTFSVHEKAKPRVKVSQR